MDKFKGLKKQEYKTVVCKVVEFNRWLKEKNINCEILEEKDCWISVLNNEDANKSFQNILQEKLGIEVHSLSYLHGQTGTYTDMIELWYRE